MCIYKSHVHAFFFLVHKLTFISKQRMCSGKMELKQMSRVHRACILIVTGPFFSLHTPILVSTIHIVPHDLGRTFCRNVFYLCRYSLMGEQGQRLRCMKEICVDSEPHEFDKNKENAIFLIFSCVCIQF